MWKELRQGDQKQGWRRWIRETDATATKALNSELISVNSIEGALRAP